MLNDRINNVQRKTLVGVVSEVMSRKIPVCRWHRQARSQGRLGGKSKWEIEEASQY